MKRTLIVLSILTSCTSIKKVKIDSTLSNGADEISIKPPATYNKKQLIVNTQKDLEAGTFLLKLVGSKLERVAYLRNSTPVTSLNYTTFPILDHNGKSDGYTQIELSTGEKGLLRSDDLLEVNISTDTTDVISIKDPYKLINFTDEDREKIKLGRSDKYIIFKNKINIIVRDLSNDREVLLKPDNLQNLERFEYTPITQSSISVSSIDQKNSKYDFFSCSSEVTVSESELNNKSVTNSTLFELGVKSAIPLLALSLTNSTTLDIEKKYNRTEQSTITLKDKNTSFEFKEIIINDLKYSILLGYICILNERQLEIIKIISDKNTSIIKKDFLTPYFNPDKSSKLLKYKDINNKELDFFTLESKLDNALWDKLSILFTAESFRKISRLNYYLKNIIKRQFILNYSKQNF